jgi:hypothetical protein
MKEELIKDCHSDRRFAFKKGKRSAVEESAVADTVAALFIHPRQLLPQSLLRAKGN